MIHLQETIRILVPALCDKTFIPCFISLYASSTFESTTFCTIFDAYPSPTNCACPQCVVCDSSTLVDSQKTKFITSYEEWIKRIGLFSPGPARIVAKLRPTRLKFGGIAWNCTMRPSPHPNGAGMQQSGLGCLATTNSVQAGPKTSKLAIDNSHVKNFLA
jgi:hypothetical protein